jgi:plasmid stability protein
LASLIIRKLDDETCERLRARAARHGVSMEEVRQILKRAVAPAERMGDLFLKVFGPGRGVELEPSMCQPHEPVKLEEADGRPFPNLAAFRESLGVAPHSGNTIVESREEERA